MKNALYALLLFLFILCGCSHKENYSIIKGIGFENKDHELFLTASCAKIEEQEVKTYHTKGNSTAELLDHLYSQSADTPYFEQNELIVISKNLGKDDIKRILHGYFSRDKRKGSEYIVCSETEPSELFDAFSAEERAALLPAKKFENRLTNNNEERIESLNEIVVRKKDLKTIYLNLLIKQKTPPGATNTGRTM